MRQLPQVPLLLMVASMCGCDGSETPADTADAAMPCHWEITDLPDRCAPPFIEADLESCRRIARRGPTTYYRCLGEEAPVVGLREGWVSEYEFLHPHQGILLFRCWSRSPPESSAERFGSSVPPSCYTGGL